MQHSGLSNNFSIALFLKYMSLSGQIYSVLWVWDRCNLTKPQPQNKNRNITFPSTFSFS